MARGAGVQDICHECGGNVVVGETCGECGQLAAPDGLAGTLTVATSVAGRRRVVTVERAPEGGWCPVRITALPVGGVGTSVIPIRS